MEPYRCHAAFRNSSEQHNILLLPMWPCHCSVFIPYSPVKITSKYFTFVFSKHWSHILRYFVYSQKILIPLFFIVLQEPKCIFLGEIFLRHINNGLSRSIKFDDTRLTNKSYQAWFLSSVSCDKPNRVFQVLSVRINSEQCMSARSRGAFTTLITHLYIFQMNKRERVRRQVRGHTISPLTFGENMPFKCTQKKS